QVSNHAVDLGHGLHVEAADEAVVRTRAEREREQNDRGRGAQRSRTRGAGAHQRGLRNKNNAWSVVPRVPGANTIFERSSCGFASRSLSRRSWNPAGSTSCLIVSTPIRWIVAASRQPEPSSALWSITRKVPPGFSA